MKVSIRTLNIILIVLVLLMIISSGLSLFEGESDITSGVIAFTIALVFLYGLVKMQKWAYYGIMAIQAIFLGLQIINFLFGIFFDFGLALILGVILAAESMFAFICIWICQTILKEHKFE